ncbi:hypothetical protein H8356DRAFT_1359694 [Neocallimastix lanati (nom. inval.)]|nr:hypothetical protein H8356DRAFT_1359694 [Neocallimastix sp. JGI-2020a]
MTNFSKYGLKLYFQTKISINNSIYLITFKEKFLVTDQIPTALFLGNKFMKKYKLHYNYNNKIIFTDLNFNHFKKIFLLSKIYKKFHKEFIYKKLNIYLQKILIHQKWIQQATKYSDHAYKYWEHQIGFNKALRKTYKSGDYVMIRLKGRSKHIRNSQTDKLLEQNDITSRDEVDS